jgi:Dolichyl-phosphate-mannose-protein mannosyltransferase
MSQRTKYKQAGVTVSARHETSAPASFEAPSTGWFASANAWIETHLDWVMWVVVLCGLFLRVRQAGASYLNGDEADTMIPPLQHGLVNVYRAALPLAHAPLVSILLHFMTFFGGSELYFRMPAVLCGTLLVFVGYKWAAETFGGAAGLITGCLISFAPPLVILSATLRYYMMHALFMTCSLYCLERAFREKSRKWMRYFGAAALVATLTEYMSAFYLAAIGAYAVVRILRRELPRPLVVEWAMMQAASLAVLIVGYNTQFRNLRGSADELYARAVWLRAWYFHPESQTLLNFLRRSSLSLFRYAFANYQLGPVMLLIFVIGIVLLLLGKVRIPGNTRSPVLSLVLPFGVTAAAGVLSVYPFGGSRHNAFLLVFMAAGISIALSALVRGRGLILLVGTVLVVPAWLKSAEQHVFDDVPQVSKVDQMKQALAYLSSRNPRPQVLMADQLGFFTLQYYLCHGQAEGFQRVAGQIVMSGCAGYRIITLDSSEVWGVPWGVPVETFPRTLAEARSAMPGVFPDPVWVFYVSPVRLTDEMQYSDDIGRFGKLEIYRVSP